MLKKKQLKTEIQRVIVEIEPINLEKKVFATLIKMASTVAAVIWPKSYYTININLTLRITKKSFSGVYIQFKFLYHFNINKNLEVFFFVVADQ